MFRWMFLRLLRPWGGGGGTAPVAIPGPYYVIAGALYVAGASAGQLTSE
jgi:hypothetical protein